MWLPKACNYATGDGGEIQVPGVLRGPVVIESELAVVVGRPLRKASPAEAHDAIFGWSVFNDVTAPEYGASGLWALGKSIDGFASWGPWIRRDFTERRVLEGLAITATVNGEQVQSGSTRHYRFSPSEVLSHISHRISLFPGDVVALGHPAAAGPGGRRRSGRMSGGGGGRARVIAWFPRPSNRPRPCRAARPRGS